MLDRFRDLVEEHQNRVYTFACYYLGNPQEAEDVTQEVLLRLWQNLSKVETASAGAWLARVTRNACYDHLRSRRSHRRVFQDGLEGPAAQAADPGDGPEAAARGWDVSRHLRKALAALDEPYRSIVILREIQGYKYQEISETLKIPLNTVKTYLHRARRALRQQLEEVHSYAHSS